MSVGALPPLWDLVHVEGGRPPLPPALIDGGCAHAPPRSPTQRLCALRACAAPQVPWKGGPARRWHPVAGSADAAEREGKGQTQLERGGRGHVPLCAWVRAGGQPPLPRADPGDMRRAPETHPPSAGSKLSSERVPGPGIAQQRETGERQRGSVGPCQGSPGQALLLGPARPLWGSARVSGSVLVFKERAVLHAAAGGPRPPPGPRPAGPCAPRGPGTRPSPGLSLGAAGAAEVRAGEREHPGPVVNLQQRR